MKTLIILLSLFVSINAISFYNLVSEEWGLFKAQFKKSYESEIEDGFRMKIFMENKAKIARHNKMYETGEVSYLLGMNQFGDLLHHEFVKVMNGYRRNLTKRYTDNAVTFIEPYQVAVPDTVDWRTAGAVTDIKNQGYCGSCWSFSATGSLEGQHFRKTGNLVSLSEQNLMDCSSKYGNHGCEGGSMDNAFKYVRDNRGIDTEWSYPYEGKDDTCHYNPASSGATDEGFVDLPRGDEEKLKIAVATVGPISVAIDASYESFRLYNGGVYQEQKCSSTRLDHGVLVVGYGTTERGGDYWLVKNSWGKSWGQDGYIKMARNKENNCGIATVASYPLV